jgi:hypothetical protein
MERKRGGGRPPTYKLNDRRLFAELIRQHGARGAREKLARKVCVATLLKVAEEFGIELKKGRRPAQPPEQEKHEDRPVAGFHWDVAVFRPQRTGWSILDDQAMPKIPSDLIRNDRGRV